MDGDGLTITLYAIRNSNGEWFRAKGRDGHSKKTWNVDLIDAKLYTKLSQARARVTFFANNYKNFPVLELVEFQAIQVKVIDETQRVISVQHKKQLEVENRKKSHAEWELKQAQAALDEAQAKIDRLTKSNRPKPPPPPIVGLGRLRDAINEACESCQDVGFYDDVNDDVVVCCCPAGQRLKGNL